MGIHAKLYNQKAWHRMRAVQLRDSPLCAYCLSMGRTTPATVADHIKPHRGNELLFWDASNLQSLCKPCHDGAKAKAEAKGMTDIGVGVDGVPLDSGHHWHAGGGSIVSG
jgi:5-methylcytosine-specific restriction protein A